MRPARVSLGTQRAAGVSPIMETSQKPPSALGQLAAVYCDEQEEPVRREQALADLIEAYAAGPADPARAKEAGNLLTQCLEPLVRRLARRVAQGATPGERADFVDEVPTLVLAARPRAGESLEAAALPRICTYRPGRSLVAWLRTVLRNLWVSGRRERERQRRALEGFARAHCDSQVAAWDVVAFAETLSAADLARIASWDYRPRVELLCLSGLWPLIPAPQWEAWLADYERLRRRPLSRPFPPDAILCCDEPAHRLRPLAELLGYSPNTLDRRWLRGQRWLNELSFVRELSTT